MQREHLEPAIRFCSTVDTDYPDASLHIYGRSRFLKILYFPYETGFTYANLGTYFYDKKYYDRLRYSFSTANDLNCGKADVYYCHLGSDYMGLNGSLPDRTKN